MVDVPLTLISLAIILEITLFSSNPAPFPIAPPTSFFPFIIEFLISILLMLFFLLYATIPPIFVPVACIVILSACIFSIPFEPSE